MSQLVDAARRYLGVPFHHRGRSSRRLDCVGLVWLAYQDCGVTLEAPTDYGREPHAERFLRAIESQLGAPVLAAPITEQHVAQGLLRVGDVVALATRKHPHHVAIVAEHPDYPLGLIHASGEHGRVVWHGLDPSYRKRIRYVFRRPVDGA